MCIKQAGETVFVALLVILAMTMGSIVFTGTVAAAENLHDGSTTDPSTGDEIYAVNSTEKKKITYGYVVENVTNTGESVELYLEFPNEVNNSANKLSSWSGNVTCICGGAKESISISSSASIVDGTDGDGVKETIKIGVQPSKKDQPIDIIVNFTGDATWPEENTNVNYDIKGAVVEPNNDINPSQKFANITVAGGLYTQTDTAEGVGKNNATLNGDLWNLNGSNSTDVWFTYWEKGAKNSTQNSTTRQSISNTGSFSENVSGLKSDTTYVYRAVTESSEDYNTGRTKQLETQRCESITSAIDSNDDGKIGDFEVLDAIDYWRDSSEVPETCGKTIDDFQVLDIIELWRNGQEV